ncbi:MAG: hypothetical protein J6L83_07545, partial [Clostridia bacterium]|nr:hypothetical protein [Clostridia bacterium]
SYSLFHIELFTNQCYAGSSTASLPTRGGFYTETKRFFFSLAERYGGGGGYYFNCIFIIVAHFDPLNSSF